MSRNSACSEPKLDRRVRRTRDRLGDAMVELLHEKPFDSIRVQDVLDRAGIARSTFYNHYRDKEDLFVSDVDDFWGRVGTLLDRRDDSSGRVAPVMELFAHVAEMRSFWSALVDSGRAQDVTDLGEAHFVRSIQRRLSREPRVQHLTEEHRTATARALAGALISLMTWWIERGASGSPEEMDDVFHAVVWNGVGGRSGRPGRGGEPKASSAGRRRDDPRRGGGALRGPGRRGREGERPDGRRT